MRELKKYESEVRIEKNLILFIPLFIYKTNLCLDENMNRQ